MKHMQMEKNSQEDEAKGDHRYFAQEKKAE